MLKFIENCKIQDFILKNNQIKSIITNKDEKYEADKFVLSSGIFSTKLANKLGLNLLMQAGKGFSFTVPKNDALNFKTPMILAEQKIAITPYDSYVRFGGTMMICGNDLSINQRRINNIRKYSNNYINNLNIQQEDMNDLWAGLRPCSPDGLPYIGKAKISNLVVASGHAMMGVSLGPASGKIVSDLINEKKTQINIKRMTLYRF